MLVLSFDDEMERSPVFYLKLAIVIILPTFSYIKLKSNFENLENP
jgi:hypothetical protein